MKYGYQIKLKVHTFVDQGFLSTLRTKFERILLKHRCALNGFSSVYVNYDVNGNIALQINYKE